MPSIAESGVPGYEAELWFGVIAPPGTPDAIVDRLNREITRFIRSDAMKARLAAQGARAIGSSREEFLSFMRAEQDKWGKVLNEIKIKPEDRVRRSTPGELRGDSRGQARISPVATSRLTS